MSALGKVIRQAAGEKLLFFCPGCKCGHWFQVGDGPPPRWTWNGNGDKPTIQPSILAQWNEGDPPVGRQCHSYVTDGRIQFLSDCTHELAGQTVDLPNFDD